MKERLAFNVAPRSNRTGVRARGLGRRPPDGPQLQTVSMAAGEAVERERWAWYGLLAFMAVLFLRPQDQIPALDVLHLADLSAVVAIGALAFGRLSTGRPIATLTPELAGMLAFGGAMVLGVPFSIWPTGSLTVIIDTFSKLLLIFVVMIGVLDSGRRIGTLTTLLVGCSGYIALRAVTDYARGVNLWEGDRIAGAVGGIFRNPNDLALNMVVFLPFALLLAFRPGSTRRRLFGAACAVLMLATIVLTRSRGGAIGLAVMVTALALTTWRVRPIIAAGVLAAVLVAVPLAPASFWTRMSSIVNAEEDPTGSRQARIELLKEGWRVFLANPVLGVGIGQFVNYAPDERHEAWNVTHNAVLQVAAETGVLGLAPFLFLIARGGMAARTARIALQGSQQPQRPGRARGGPTRLAERVFAGDPLASVALAAGPSMAGWFVCAQFASVALNWTFYLVLALAVATRDVARRAAAPPALVSAA